MIKRRRNERSDGDLADVNEQELAKSGERERTDFGAEGDMGADNASGGSAPVLGEDEAENDVDVAAEAENGNDEAVLPMPSESAELPCQIPDEEGEQKSEDTFDDETPVADGRDGDMSGNSQKERHKKGRGYIFIMCLCMVISVAILVLTLMGGRDGADMPDSTDATQTDGDEPSDTQLQVGTADNDTVTVYEACVGASVTVCSVQNGKTEYYTGVGVFGEGYIATLYQAVADKESVEIMLSDGTLYSARVIGGDATANIALLQTYATDLEYVKVAPTDSVSVGDGIYVIGCAGDGRYGASLATGVVSYEQRTPELEGFDGYRRRVRAIQLGGSFDCCMMGAPVFDAQGEAVAIMLKADGSSVSFALPLERVCVVLDAIRKGEEVSAEVINELAYIPPTLGILGVQAQFENEWGIAVKGFSDETSDAAEKLRIDDIIFKVNGTLTPDTVSLVGEIDKHRPLDEVEVYVYRNGQKLSFFVKLAAS